MKIAVVGSGIAGLAAAWRLSDAHDIEIFEASDHIGGHTHTVPVEEDGKTWNVDTGFVVFNERTYPGLCAFFDELGVKSRSSCMSFSVKCSDTGLEYQGSSLSGFFATRRSLCSPAHVGMLFDIQRFHRHAHTWLRSNAIDDRGIGQWVQDHGLGQALLERYLLPIGSSIWSCGVSDFASFPARFVLEFMANHEMLQIRNRPIWRTVEGGSSAYVSALCAAMDVKMHLNTPVRSVRRVMNGVQLETDSDSEIHFDHVIMAVHADDAMNIVSSPDAVEAELLSSFPYTSNDIVLHQDTTILPKNPKAWASWNYLLDASNTSASVTYDMSRLQGLQSSRPMLVTLNAAEEIAADKVISRWTTGHPTYHAMRGAAQERHAEMIDREGISYCGAYWGYGFHEDGYQSGMRVSRALLQCMEGAA